MSSSPQQMHNNRKSLRRTRQQAEIDNDEIKDQNPVKRMKTNPFQEIIDLCFEGKKVRHIIDENNDLWFVAVDIAKILEYTKVRQAADKNVSRKYQKYFSMFSGASVRGSSNLQSQTKLISEPGTFHTINN